MSPDILDQSEEMNGKCCQFLVIDLLGDSAARFSKRRSGIDFTLSPENQAQASKRSGAVGHWRGGRMRQCPFHPLPALTQITSMMPEDGERPGEPKHAF